MPRKIVAGNWKMNNNLAATEDLLANLKKQVYPEDVTVIVAPSFTNLYHTYNSLKSHNLEIAAQNMHQSNNGAFTGEISADMLKTVGVSYVILGHSERRAYFGETNAVLAEKVNTALENDLEVIFCVGEELKDRKNENQFKVVEKQLQEGLFHIANKSWEKITIAYEPVWAIGTGETASPEQAQEMHAYIRKIISENYSEKIASEVSILYGGSVKPNNASEIFSQKDVNGGLIGGAALKAEDFMTIINAF